jgi:hypothetical protein
MPALICSPPSVHFSGFVPNEVCQVVVSITNVSQTTLKVDILPTASDHFKLLEVQKQLPKLAPGISERVTVLFKATDFKYFYDFFKVVCSNGEQLTVDLHAYPVGFSSVSSCVLPPHRSYFAGVDQV